MVGQKKTTDRISKHIMFIVIVIDLLLLLDLMIFSLFFIFTVLK